MFGSRHKSGFRYAGLRKWNFTDARRARVFLPSPWMEGFGGPSQPSPTVTQCLNGGYGWLQVKCRRCEAEASIPLEHVRRSRDTPIWKLEAALECRSCRTPRYSPPMNKLTNEREITPYVWVRTMTGELTRSYFDLRLSRTTKRSPLQSSMSWNPQIGFLIWIVA
jgi:hypothetical protein